VSKIQSVGEGESVDGKLRSSGRIWQASEGAASRDDEVQESTPDTPP